LSDNEGVGRTDHPPDFHVVVQERDELVPRVLPEPDNRPVPVTQRSVNSSNAARAAAAFTAVWIDQAINATVWVETLATTDGDYPALKD
jgi:hypothetical protein